MRQLLLIIATLNVWPLVGQTFNMRYDLRDIHRAQVALGIEATNDGYIVIQISDELDTISPGLYFNFSALGLTKIDYQGTKVWDKRFVVPFHGKYAGWANCCDTLPGGGFVVAGSIEDTLENLQVHLAVFDAEGDTVFTRNLGSTGPRWNARMVKRLQDDGFAIVGQTEATGYLDGFAIRTDAQGNEIWRRTYGEPSPQTDGLLSILELSDGSFVMGGSQFPTPTTKQFWVQRTDASGEVLWDTLWGPMLPGAGAYIDKLSDGNVIMAGNWSYTGPGFQRRFYMAKLDPYNGEFIWDREYGAIENFQVLFACKEAPDGDIIACGVSEEIGGMQGVLLRTTAEGDSLWMFRYFYQDDVISTGTGQFYDVLPTPDGGFIATGPAYNPLNNQYPPGYSQDAWVVKVDGQGCIIPGCNSVSIEEQATNLLGALRIWPNPVQSGGQVHVELDLPQHLQRENLQLTVVAMDGKVVHTQEVPPLSHFFTLSLSHLSSGLYHLHITNGSTWLTGGKLVVE